MVDHRLGSQTTQYIYTSTEPDAGASVPRGDLLRAIVYPDSTGGGDRVAFTYYGDGSVKTRMDQRGLVHTYSYDNWARQTADTVTLLPVGVDATVLRLGTSYNDAGLVAQRTSYSDANGTVVKNQLQYAYDGANFNQVSASYQAHAGVVNTSSTPQVGYGYTVMGNGVSRLTSMTYANGRTLTYQYGGGGTGLQDRLALTLGRVSQISDGSGTLATYRYLGDGTLAGLSRPLANLNLSFGTAADNYSGLDGFNRIKRMQWIGSGNVTLDQHNYGYDADGNRLYAENVLSPANSELYSTGIGYDGLNRMPEFSRGTLNGDKNGMTGNVTRSQSYGMDGLGNIQTLNDAQLGNQTRGYNTANEMTTLTGTGLDTPTFDASGNMNKDEKGNTLIYDAWNRLALVQTANGTVLATYGYDALNRRITEVAGGITKDLYYSEQWQVLEERYNGATTDKVSNVWGTEYVNALVCRDFDANANGALESGERLWSLYDANYNVTALVTPAGAVQQRFVYDPYGVVMVLDASWAKIGDGSASNAVQNATTFFQGGRYDATSGLYTFQNRDYTPTLQRWTERDPAGYKDGMDLYSAFGGAPVGKVDPSGLEWKDPSLDPIEMKEREAALYAAMDKLAAEEKAGWKGVFGDNIWGAKVAVWKADAACAPTFRSELPGPGYQARTLSEEINRMNEFLRKFKRNWWASAEEKILANDYKTRIRIFEDELSLRDTSPRPGAVARTIMPGGGWDQATGLFAGAKGGIPNIPGSNARDATILNRSNFLRGAPTVEIRYASGELQGAARATLAEQVQASRAAWARNPAQIAESINALGGRALARSGGNGAQAEAIFEGYLARVSNRLESTGSRFGVEWQPAALSDGTRVPGFIYYRATEPSHIEAFPGSRRLDAGIIDLTRAQGEYGLHPVVHGFDITVSATKRNIVPYYQQYFGPIPIDDIRLPR